MWVFSAGVAGKADCHLGFSISCTTSWVSLVCCQFPSPTRFAAWRRETESPIQAVAAGSRCIFSSHSLEMRLPRADRSGVLPGGVPWRRPSPHQITSTSGAGPERAPHCPPSGLPQDLKWADGGGGEEKVVQTLRWSSVTPVQGRRTKHG